jgi:hypothetical protein
MLRTSDCAGPGPAAGTTVPSNGSFFELAVQRLCKS